MSSPLPIASEAVGLAAQLTVRLRPMFAEPVILVDRSDPVIGGPQCIAAACERLAVLEGTCSAHHQRWIDDGRPEIQEWAAAVPAIQRWLQQPRRCVVMTCRRARRQLDLCHSHVVRWNNQGRPDLENWIGGGGGGAPLAAGQCCRFLGCELDAEGGAGLCGHHRDRWCRAGRPPLDSWLLTCETFGRDRFDLRPLPMPMRLEIAYAIQCRVDERRTQTRPHQIRRLLRALPGGGVNSLLGRSTESWMSYLGFSSERGYIERRFLLDAVGYLRDLIEGVGWDAEYPRDVWLLRRLGYPGRDTCLRFTGIEPIWLRQLTKRWARWRLSTGISIGTVSADVRAITSFAQCFPVLQRGPEALTREVIEIHLAHLATRFPNAKSRTSQISSLAGLLHAARQHGWEPRLEPRVDLFREDYPWQMIGAPRGLSEAVMAQLEREDILAWFRDPRGRLLARILMSTGLRIGDASSLRVDCVVRDGQGAPYLHYTNHKMAREAFVPIGVELADAITAQQQAVLAEFAEPDYLLPRPTSNPEGKLPFSTATFRGELREWLCDCGIRDEHGRAVRVTPHQWRHTFATRMKVRGIASDASFDGFGDRVVARDLEFGESFVA